MTDLGNFLAALSRDTLADVVRDLQQAIADGSHDLLMQERKPQNVYRNNAFRVDSYTARFLNGYTPARFETGIIENGTPTTERIVPPQTSLPSMNTDLLARHGMNVLPGPDPLRPAEH